MKAVRFHEYGGVDVLRVEDVELPPLARSAVAVEVRAAGINPGEVNIRTGVLHDRFPTTFPCGQGSDFAGVVAEVGADVTGWEVGDEVLGWSWDRASHAERVQAPDTQIIAKPENLPWDVAGSLYIAGCTAWAAVRAVAATAGDIVVVSGATGGVGCLVVQLLRAAGARVVAISSERHTDWLAAQGAVVAEYGNGLADRIAAAAPQGITAFIDLFGGGYVKLAVQQLGVSADRINTIIDFDAAQEFGVHTLGSSDGTSTDVLTELARLAASGDLVLPIAASYPLNEVQTAFTELEKRHTFGKIVLQP